jgi:transglutaminase/protease-like cytokinesis protein 3
MARAEKSDKYSKILNRAKSDPETTPSIKKDLNEGLSKLSEYGKKIREQAKAIIDKDVEKSLRQSKGGFIKGYPKLAKKGWK